MKEYLMIKIRNAVRPILKGDYLIWKGLRAGETSIPLGYRVFTVGKYYRLTADEARADREEALVFCEETKLYVYIDRFEEPIEGYPSKLLRGKY
jgi:hypothetical protein